MLLVFDKAVFRLDQAFGSFREKLHVYKMIITIIARSHISVSRILEMYPLYHPFPSEMYPLHHPLDYHFQMIMARTQHKFRNDPFELPFP